MKDQSWLGVGVRGPAQVSAPSVSQQHPHFTVLPEQLVTNASSSHPAPTGPGFDFLGGSLGSCLDQLCFVVLRQRGLRPLLMES